MKTYLVSSEEGADLARRLTGETPEPGSEVKLDLDDEQETAVVAAGWFEKKKQEKKAAA